MRRNSCCRLTAASGRFASGDWARANDKSCSSRWRWRAMLVWICRACSLASSARGSWFKRSTCRESAVIGLRISCAASAMKRCCWRMLSSVRFNRRLMAAIKPVISLGASVSFSGERSFSCRTDRLCDSRFTGSMVRETTQTVSKMVKGMDKRSGITL